MPTCSEQYGPGWVGDYPNCRYDASTPGGQGGDQTPFTGTVGSLGYGDILEGSSWEDDWQKFFDPYDTRKEEMQTRHAGMDVGQLEEAWGLTSGQLGEAWDLKQTQLGETWGQQQEQLGEAWGLRGAQLGETLELGRGQLGESWRLQSADLGGQWGGQRQELGAGARGAFQDVERMIAGMTQRGRGLTFGGQRQRQAEEEVSGAYARNLGLGRSAYERAMEGGRARYRQGLESQTTGYEQAMATGQQQYEQALETGELGYQQALSTGELGYQQALETGQLGLQQATTDIYQGLESDIFGGREGWLAGQRGTLNMLLGSGIWDDDNPPPDIDPPPRCPPGQQMALPGSGQTGCVPIPGGYTPPTTLGPTYEPEYTGMGEEDVCISKGGTWVGGSCQYG